MSWGSYGVYLFISTCLWSSADQEPLFLLSRGASVLSRSHRDLSRIQDWGCSPPQRTSPDCFPIGVDELYTAPGNHLTAPPALTIFIPRTRNDHLGIEWPPRHRSRDDRPLLRSLTAAELSTSHLRYRTPQPLFFESHPSDLQVVGRGLREYGPRRGFHLALGHPHHIARFAFFGSAMGESHTMADHSASG